MERVRAALVVLAVIGLWLGLGGCGQTLAPGAHSPMQSPITSAGAGVSQTASPTTAPSDSQPGTPPSPPTGFQWSEAGRFTEDGLVQAVTDMTDWAGGFLAIGQAWPIGSDEWDAQPRIWLSEDGRSWTAIRPDLGDSRLELRGILPVSNGDAIVVGHHRSGGAEDEARAWRSSDGRTWTAIDLPSEFVGPNIEVASGPIGHLLSTGTELWYSTDVESWQRVHATPEGVELREPVAGDEGFVVPASRIGGEDAPVIYASGDGVTWYQATAPTYMPGTASWRGDWLGWGYTDDPPTISVLRSANGLDWSVALDVNDLTPPDGPKAGRGMESGITEVTVAGDDGVAAMTLGWNHCCAMPPMVVDVFLSADGETWTAANLPESTYISSLATDGELVALAGQYERGRGVVFWVSER